MQDLAVGDVVELKLRADIAAGVPHTGTITELRPEKQQIIVKIGASNIPVPTRCYQIRKIS